jgi:hypothetical protein
MQPVTLSKYLRFHHGNQHYNKLYKILRKNVGVWSRDNAVCIAGRPRGRSLSHGRVKKFLRSTSSRQAPGPTQLPIQWVPWVISPRVNHPGRQADHLPSTSTEVKKTWIIHQLPRTSSWRGA